VTLSADLSRSLKRQYMSQVAGLAAATIAATSLFGFWAELPLLTSWGPGFPGMRPTGAWLLAVVGLTLVRPGKDSRVAFAVGFAIIILAALSLAGILFNLDLAIVNYWLAPRVELPPASFQARSAGTVTAVLLGSSLVLIPFERYHFAATVLAGIAGSIAVFALLGYLAGIDAIYGSVSVNSPPLPSVVGLLCVAVGIISRVGTMPALRTRRPLWHLLVMLGCAIVVPLLLFAMYAGARIAEAQLRQVQENLTIEAHALSANVDREIIGEIERLQALAASQSLRQGDFAEFQRQAEASLVLRQSGNIMLIDGNMQQLVNTWVPYGRALPKTAAPEPVQRALAIGKPQITGIFLSSIIKQLVFAIIVPVEIDGENRYVLSRSPSPQALAGLVAANQLPPGWQAAVFDADHRTVAQSEHHDAFVGKERPSAQRHRKGSDNVFEFVDADGQPSLEAYARSQLSGWETAVWAPKALLEGSVRAQWWTLSVIALMAFVLVIALTSWLGRFISRSVGEAARAAVALGEGKLVALGATPVAEVDTLIAELGRAAARREAAENLLRRSKDRLELALDAAQLGSWRYDPLTRVISGDARWQEIFEAAKNEALIEEILHPVLPDDAERLWDAIKAALDPIDPKRSAAEFRFRRKNGEVRWVETLGLAYFGGSGRERRAVRMVGTAQDITERKEREEKEHLLMREISHRAKNMLSVVHAIAQQTAAKNPEDFVERFSERIRALSANHDLLVRSDWGGVDVEDLALAQLSHFADLIGFRIFVDGPKLRLNPASTQAIGLALHELSTNAAKYGALSTDAGFVDISWRITGGTFAMSWIERAGPIVSPPQRRGFGTTVIEAMAERSLSGTVNLDYAPSGLTWRLTCPAANALEAWEQISSFEGKGRLRPLAEITSDN
jgi:PAS domain S-box-containing protein